MKKITFLLLATTLLTGKAMAASRLSSVSVSENGTVMLTTGSPNEFKSSWTGQAGQFKMIIELPGVTVDSTAKVLGNLAASRGIKSVRFSQFDTDPPVARVVIETPERLSYSWSTKPDGVELHFMFPSSLPKGAGTGPKATTGFTVPSNVFSQPAEGNEQAPAGRHLAVTPPPASSARQTAQGGVPPKPENNKAIVTATPASSAASGAKIGSTGNGSKPSAAVSSSTLKGTNGFASESTDTAAKRGNANVAALPTGTTEKMPLVGGTTTPATTTPNKSVVTVTAPFSGQQKDSAGLKPATSGDIERTGTTTPTKSVPSAGPFVAPTSGGTGVVVKPSSPTPGKPTAAVSASTAAEKSKVTTGAPATSATATATLQAPSTSKTVAGATVPPAIFSSTAKPTVSGPPPAPTVTVTKPAEAVKPGPPPAAKAQTSPAPPSSVAALKPGERGSTDTVDQEKFKEQLKKALGDLETPGQATEAKPTETDEKAAAPIKKLGESNFQEQLKKALDPARSLTDTGEVADIDDIDTDLPATDEEEIEPYDTSLAFPGGTFMQVSPSRKVIRYHSEGRRDPFSPLTGRDRYASGKKRRAAPAAEQLRLVGIMRSLAGNKALLEDGEGNGYIIAPGERVRNGYLVSVSENKVLFQVTEFGWTKTVAMELGTFE